VANNWLRLIDLDEFRQVQPKEGRLLASKFACGYAESGRNLNLHQIVKGIFDISADIKTAQNAPILSGTRHSSPPLMRIDALTHSNKYRVLSPNAQQLETSTEAALWLSPTRSSKSSSRESFLFATEGSTNRAMAPLAQRYGDYLLSKLLASPL